MVRIYSRLFFFSAAKRKRKKVILIIMPINLATGLWFSFFIFFFNLSLPACLIILDLSNLGSEQFDGRDKVTKPDFF